MPSWISAFIQKFKRLSKRESQIHDAGTRWVDTDSVWSPTSSLFLRSPDSTRSSHGILPAIFGWGRRRNAFSSGQTQPYSTAFQNELIAARTSERIEAGRTSSWSNALSFEDEETSSFHVPRSLSAEDGNKAWHCLQSAFESGSDVFFDSPLSRITKGLSDSTLIPTPVYSYPRFVSTPISESRTFSTSTVNRIEVEEDPKAPRYAQRVALPIPRSKQRLVYIPSPRERKPGRKLPAKFALRMPFTDDVDDEIPQRPSFMRRSRSFIETSQRPVSALSRKSLPLSVDVRIGGKDLSDGQVGADAPSGKGTARRRASEGWHRPYSEAALQDLGGNASWYSLSTSLPAPRFLDFRSRLLFSKARASQRREKAYKGEGDLNAMWAPDLKEEGLRRRRLRRGRTRV